MSTPCTQEDRITRIEDAVDEVSKSVGALSSDMAVIKDKIVGMVDQVSDHEHVLRGSNGEIGVIAKIENSLKKIDRVDTAIYEDGGLRDSMRDVASYIKSCQEEKKGATAEKKDNYRWLWRLITGAVITGLISWVLVLLNMK